MKDSETDLSIVGSVTILSECFEHHFCIKLIDEELPTEAHSARNFHRYFCHYTPWPIDIMNSNPRC